MISLASPLPLPSTSDWPDFLAPISIPYGFGRVTSVGIPINQRRTRFVWLAGRNAGVDSVTVDGSTVREWQWSNTVDPANNPATIVEFNAPLKTDPHITGRGHLSSADGSLIDNPADVIDFIYALYSRTPTDIDLFRAACDGITVAGLLDDSEGHLQIQSICDSIGALWADSAPGFGFLWPASAGDSRYTIASQHGLAAEFSLDSIFTRVRVRYGYDAAAGKYRGSVLLRSSSADDYGDITRTIDAAWCPDSRQAASLGTRLLNTYSRPVWRYTSQVPTTDLYPGDTVTVSHHRAPATGDALIQTSEIDDWRGRSQIMAEIPTGDAVQITTLQISTAFDESTVSAGFETLDGRVRIPITNEAGAPLPGARVTWDQTHTFVADSSGRITVPAHMATPGDHTMRVEHQDHQTVELVVTL